MTGVILCIRQQRGAIPKVFLSINSYKTTHLACEPNDFDG